MEERFTKEFCSDRVGLRDQKRWTAAIGGEYTQPRCANSFRQILVEYRGIQGFLQTEGVQHCRVDLFAALTVLMFQIDFRFEADPFFQPLEALRSGKGIDAQIIQNRVWFLVG